MSAEEPIIIGTGFFQPAASFEVDRFMTQEVRICRIMRWSS
jgi:hypothetical protein